MSDRGVVATNGLKVFAHVAAAGMIPGGTLKSTPSAGYAQTAEDLYLRWKLIDDHGRAAGENRVGRG